MITYERTREVDVGTSAGMMVKNLQVVSFDKDWMEVYLGTVQRDHFGAVCPNRVDRSVATTVDVTWQMADYDSGEQDCEEMGTIGVGVHDEGEGQGSSSVPKEFRRQDKKRPTGRPAISCAKWCPLEHCTVLVLGSQYGVQMFDWDGSNLIYSYDFHENGIGADDELATGPMAKGVAAIGTSYIAVGIHTGTIILFLVELGVNGPAAASVDGDDEGNDIIRCSISDTQRQHIDPISDLASMVIPLTSSSASDDHHRDILASGDEAGKIRIWELKGGALNHLRVVESFGEAFPVTALSLWSKMWEGVIVAGYGSGHVRIFRVKDGTVAADICAHAGWINGMDLASQTGKLVTTGEDGGVRVWQLSESGRIVQPKHLHHWDESVTIGVKFLDPKGLTFALATYDSARVQIFSLMTQPST